MNNLISGIKDRIQKILKNESDKRQVAWISASLSRNLMYYQNTLHHPEDFKDTASETYAKMTIRDFKELLNTDKGAAKIIYETYFYELWEMVRNGLKEDPQKYFHFYYSSIYSER